MTRTVHLHVGSPKSGTTYLQRILDGNREALADAGVLVVGDAQVDRVQAALQLREDPRVAKLPPHRQRMWDELVARMRAWDGDRAILSYELLSAATPDQVARAMSDLAGLEVHVVITARDLARSVSSAWQERLKFGLTTPLEEWRPPAADVVRGEWGWRTLDPASVTERWGSGLPPERIHLVTVPRPGAGEAELWRRFAEACDLSGATVSLTPARTNESLGAAPAEMLRRLNTRLRPPLDTDRAQARWLRDVLAHRILVPQGGEPLAITEEQFAEAAARADAAIAALAERGVRVHGDLEELRATRPEGALPSEATDAAVLDVALDTVLELLLLLRERTVDAPDERPGGTKRLVQRAAQWVSRSSAGDRDEELPGRIAAIEAAIAEDRALHQRVAALQDVVTELLMTADLRDGGILYDAIRRYRTETL